MQVDWLADDAVDKGGSMVVGVFSGGELVHFTAAGELVTGESPDAQTRYRAGSISKLFTAVAVMRLHEEGLLDIDAPAFEAMQLAIETITGERPAVFLESVTVEGPSPFSKEELDALGGVYGTQFGVFDIWRKNNGLRAELMGTLTKLVPTEQGTFRIRPVVGGVVLPMLIDDVELRFEEVNGAMVMGMRGPSAGQMWLPGSSRFQPAQVNDAWADRIGVWEPLNNEDSTMHAIEARITDESGYLVLEVDLVLPTGDKSQTFAASELGEDYAVVGGTSQGAGETAWIEDTGGGEVLHFWGTEYSKVSELPTGCGCSAAPGRGMPAFLVFLLGLAAARRRPR